MDSHAAVGVVWVDEWVVDSGTATGSVDTIDPFRGQVENSLDRTVKFRSCGVQPCNKNISHPKTLLNFILYHTVPKRILYYKSCQNRKIRQTKSSNPNFFSGMCREGSTEQRIIKPLQIPVRLQCGGVLPNRSNFKRLKTGWIDINKNSHTGCGVQNVD